MLTHLVHDTELVDQRFIRISAVKVRRFLTAWWCEPFKSCISYPWQIGLTPSLYLVLFKSIVFQLISDLTVVHLVIIGCFQPHFHHLRTGIGARPLGVLLFVKVRQSLRRRDVVRPASQKRRLFCIETLILFQQYVLENLKLKLSLHRVPGVKLLLHYRIRSCLLLILHVYYFLFGL